MYNPNSGNAYSAASKQKVGTTNNQTTDDNSRKASTEKKKLWPEKDVLFDDLTAAQQMELNTKWMKIRSDWESDRPAEDDFNDIYPQSQIDQHKREIKDKESRPDFKKEKTQAAVIAEYGIAQLIESDALLSDSDVELHIEMTSTYDDYFHGVDFIIEVCFKEGEEPIRYGMDIKTNEGADQTATPVREARERTKASVMGKGGSELTYYIDPKTGEKKGRMIVPSMVMVLDAGEMLKYSQIIAMSPYQRKKIKYKQNVEYRVGGSLKMDEYSITAEEYIGKLRRKLIAGMIAECEQMYMHIQILFTEEVKKNKNYRIPRHQAIAASQYMKLIEYLKHLKK